ncbi:hypothetical protein LBMAG53_10550 [Planctomycetota bacterium]|nr:hypothetical protein LBMAG53_10550 [Planctomycetota bacterium]
MSEPSVAASSRLPLWVSCALATLILVVLYVLSIGPVAWLYFHDTLPPGWYPYPGSVPHIYTPLTWTCERLGLETQLLWYIGLWIPLPHP